MLLSHVHRMAGSRLPAVTLVYMERAPGGGSGDLNAVLVRFLRAVMASSVRLED